MAALLEALLLLGPLLLCLRGGGPGAAGPAGRCAGRSCTGSAEVFLGPSGGQCGRPCALVSRPRVSCTARAAVRDVSIPRLLVEAALNEHVVISSEWKAAAADLMDLRSKLGYTANNINQLAKFANSEGQFPAEAEAALAEYKALIPQIQAAVARVAGL